MLFVTNILNFTFKLLSAIASDRSALDREDPFHITPMPVGSTTTALERTFGLMNVDGRLSLRTIIIINEMAWTKVTAASVKACFEVTGALFRLLLVPLSSKLLINLLIYCSGVCPRNPKIFAKRKWIGTDSFESAAEGEQKERIAEMELELQRSSRRFLEKVCCRDTFSVNSS
jgi:hypothetical protein